MFLCMIVSNKESKLYYGFYWWPHYRPLGFPFPCVPSSLTHPLTPYLGWYVIWLLGQMLGGGAKAFSAFRPIGEESAVLNLWSEKEFL